MKRKYSRTSGAQERHRGCLPDPVHPGPVEERVLNQQVIFPSCLDQVSGAKSLELPIVFAKKSCLTGYAVLSEKESLLSHEKLVEHLILSMLQWSRYMITGFCSPRNVS